MLLTGPGGKKIQSSTDGINIDDGALVIRQPSTGQTLIEIPNALRGKWTLQSAPGGPVPQMVETAQVLADPVITTTVSGRGAHRLLHYRIKPQPGLKVTFLDGVDSGASLIGHARGTSGTIPFTPSLGSSKPRTIIARVERDGQAAPSIVVGRYLPGTLRPGRASRISLKHTRAGWRVTWRAGALATSQQLTADGVQTLIATKAARRSLTLSPSPSLDSTQPTAVGIVALRGQAAGRRRGAAPQEGQAVSRRPKR